MTRIITRPRRKVRMTPTFDNLVSEFFNTAIGDMARKTDRYFTNPAMNVVQIDQGIELHLALPGFNKEQVDISVHNDVLTIKSKLEAGDNEPKYRLREFNYSQFNKSFTLPEDYDQESITARFENGVLIVGLSKKAELQAPEPKAIEIK